MLPPIEQTEEEIIIPKKDIWYVGGGIILIIIVFSLYYFFIKTPASFQSGTIVSIDSGQSLVKISKEFQDKHIVSSSFLLTNLIILENGEHSVVSGDYYFSRGESLYKVAKRITTGDYEITPIKVTIPEGSNVYDISSILLNKIDTISPIVFLNEAKAKEGYLFPDTYFFLPTVTPDGIISLMSDNFNSKITPLQDEIKNSGRSESQIIIMASILEEEAKTDSDRKIVAGILWKRLDSGLPLQVDSTLRYITGKTSSELTVTDLKSDSPYNTYVNKGLPIGPISNPGLESIEAALNPTTTKYLYFLSDASSTLHYAVTLKEHDANRKKYLN